MKILSIPERVCAQHSLEFWTGLLAFAGDRSAPSMSESDVRARAIAAAGPSPWHQDAPIRLAS